MTTTEQNYDIENLTKRSYDLTPFKTDLNLDADVCLKNLSQSRVVLIHHLQILIKILQAKHE